MIVMSLSVLQMGPVIDWSGGIVFLGCLSISACIYAYTQALHGACMRARVEALFDRLAIDF